MNKLHFIWAGSVLIAFYLGYRVALPASPTASDESAALRINVPQTGIVSAVTSSSADNNKTTIVIAPLPTADNTEVEFSPTQFLTAARSLMGKSRYALDYKGVANVYGLVQGLSEQQLERLMLDSLAAGEQGTDTRILAILISQYAEHNPQGAIDFIDANITSPRAKLQLTLSAITSWTKIDPEAAFSWYQVQNLDAKEQGLFSGQRNSLPIIFDGLARQNIDLALAKLSTLADSGLHLQAAVSGIAYALTGKEQFAELIAKTESLNSEQIRLSIVPAWVMQNPGEVAEWLDNDYLGEDKDQLRERAMAVWMYSHPKQSADWFMQGASAEDRQFRVEKVVDSWSGSSPQGALDWLRVQRGIDFDAALIKLLNRSAFSNQEFVMENLELLDDEEKKSDIAFNVYLSLKHQSKEKAEQFINTSEYKSALQQRANYLAKEDDN